MFHVSHTMIRRLTVLAAVLVAVAVVSPLASAKRYSALECQVTPAQWISINDDLGVPWLQQASGTRCTADAATTDTSCAAGHSPFPGWVQVTDDLGIPYLVPTGSQSATPACAAGPAAPAVSQPTLSPNEPQRTASPYPGWVVVLDDLGVPWLEAISSYR